MKANHKITGAEREVMEVLWKYSEPLQTRELLEEMKERGKKWKRQTLNTLLFRLEEKGIVSRVAKPETGLCAGCPVRGGAAAGTDTGAAG